MATVHPLSTLASKLRLQLVARAPTQEVLGETIADAFELAIDHVRAHPPDIGPVDLAITQADRDWIRSLGHEEFGYLLQRYHTIPHVVHRVNVGEHNQDGVRVGQFQFNARASEIGRCSRVLDVSEEAYRRAWHHIRHACAVSSLRGKFVPDQAVNDAMLARACEELDTYRYAEVVRHFGAESLRYNADLPLLPCVDIADARVQTQFHHPFFAFDGYRAHRAFWIDQLGRRALEHRLQRNPQPLRPRLVELVATIGEHIHLTRQLGVLRSIFSEPRIARPEVRDLVMRITDLLSDAVKRVIPRTVWVNEMIICFGEPERKVAALEQCEIEMKSCITNEDPSPAMRIVELVQSMAASHFKHTIDALARTPRESNLAPRFVTPRVYSPDTERDALGIVQSFVEAIQPRLNFWATRLVIGGIHNVYNPNYDLPPGDVFDRQFELSGAQIDAFATDIAIVIVDDLCAVYQLVQNVTLAIELCEPQTVEFYHRVEGAIERLERNLEPLRRHVAAFTCEYNVVNAARVVHAALAHLEASAGVLPSGDSTEVVVYVCEQLVKCNLRHNPS